MGESTTDGDAEAYLRRASKLKWKHFASGHSSVSQKKAGLVEVKAAECASKLPMRLPMKKLKRAHDSDSDSENVRSPCLAAVTPPTASVISFSSRTPAEKPRNGAKMTLMEKWFPGRTLGNATLDAAQAPTMVYTDLSVARMNAARERLLTLRSGVEDVTNYTSVNGDSGVAGGTTDWNWLELRDALSQLTSRDAFRTKKRVVRAVKWLSASKTPLRGVPNSATPRLWEKYVHEHGPECGHAPPLSMLVWLDSACTTALFTALVSRMLKWYKQGMKPVMRTPYALKENALESDQNAGVADEEEGEVDEDASESHDVREENKQEADGYHNRPVFFTNLPTLNSGGASEEIISLLSFLRVLMPVDVEDASGNVHRSVGYGVWLYACLSAVDTPLDPDLDRLVHELFGVCCQQLRTLGEAHGIQGGNRGAIVHAFSPRSGDNTLRREYNAMHDVRREDVLALHTIIIILAKLFRQNQNRLIPL
ncbi:hypothetical protein TraAM80_08478 [Trypanosoma rangeli]|uniref:Uncharacterized protein n=1 Tax=Trypanosoma rangeli TaxID=5698 RepID=A0A3R7RAQ0_TRYRA|nr:uncharacterized protein TraAM80_08478 [Trypanosoma rangeli]RNE98968.1 hypothetical protein TraAM80_08478 [Trypanosoma rangeli]|eukprot:RNE98968.1 hypothetical protein TraAM80_08478 [Trypanosoma rangeli]